MKNKRGTTIEDGAASAATRLGEMMLEARPKLQRRILNASGQHRNKRHLGQRKPLLHDRARVAVGPHDRSPLCHVLGLWPQLQQNKVRGDPLATAPATAPRRPQRRP